MRRFPALALFVPFLLLSPLVNSEPAGPGDRDAALKLMEQGNYLQAYAGFSRLALNLADDPRLVGKDFSNAVDCLRQLGRLDELDAFREKVVSLHKANWRLLMAAAVQSREGPSYGFMVAGEFQRGNSRGGGNYVTSAGRDRARALQLLVQALPSVGREPGGAEVGAYYQTLAGTLFRGGGQIWRLQYRTDLSELPDYGEEDNGGGRWAPVDEHGTPLFHRLPPSWASAESDGERWRWALAQAGRADPSLLPSLRRSWADFLSGQFGVETLAEYGWFFGRLGEADGNSKDKAGVWQIHTLAEDETIAKLAGGIKRFRLPEDMNFISIYKELKAYDRLAELFENRRQYGQAADYWKKAMEAQGQWETLKDKPLTYSTVPEPRSPNGVRGRVDSFRQGLRNQVPVPAWERYRQILGNWGDFEAAATQAAGPDGAFDFRYRNGARVHFEAQSVNVDRLLSDVKEFLRSQKTDGSDLNWEKSNVENIGFRFVTQSGDKYLGKKVASWDVALDPRPGHFDRRVTVPIPFKQGGAFLVTSKMEGGNQSRIVLWRPEVALLEKPVDGGQFYFAADARSGQPIAGAALNFFGYKAEYESVPRGRGRYRIATQEFTDRTDDGGQRVVKADQVSRDFQWMVEARTQGGKTAYLGFRSIWSPTLNAERLRQDHVFLLSDRPVYRPGQPTRFKAWANRAAFDQEGRSPFAGTVFDLTITNPQGETVFQKRFTADERGGFDGDWTLPADAKLGVYQIHVAGQAYGGLSFRVEEYKKPEFEVTVESPEEGVRLGDRISVPVTAKYYFGAPVTEAKVKFKILRSEQDVRWFPAGPWDWLYGNGYGWYSNEYPWWPKWSQWGCRRPAPFWGGWWGGYQPPELVAEGEMPLGKDGTLKLPLDTSLAQALHPDQDHRYDITVEVTDRSRRTIVGQGSVRVTRKPFTVYAWTDRGHYQAGDAIQGNFTALTADQKPVVDARARLSLFKVTYLGKEGKPRETPVQTWNLKTDAEGHVSVQVKAAAKGQYRLSAWVTNARGVAVEGGSVLVVRGNGAEGGEFRFNDIELVADRRDYAPGDRARLLINTAQSGSHVLFFARPRNGIYAKPEGVALTGKSVLKELEILKGDMPNIFVEAVTIRGGRVYTETREIVVPPENRVMNVEVRPSAPTYKPGEKASFKIRVTDPQGKPVQGSLALTVYDKSLEYISGGTNVPDIRKNFWNWRRSHQPTTISSLTRSEYPLAPWGEFPMGYLGIFGSGVADEEAESFKGGPRKNALSLGLSKSEGAFMREDVRSMACDSAAPAERRAGGVGGSQDKDQSLAQAVQPVVRTQFADAAHWVARLETNAKGEAETSFTLPDNLTTWKSRVWAMGDGSRVGEGTVEVVAAKKVLVRLQAPRFFVQKDEVVLSANVHNYLKTTKAVRVSLAVNGDVLELISGVKEKTVTIPTQGEERVDWRVRVRQAGEAVVRMTALTDEESDSAEMRFPAYVHGAPKTESFCGSVRPEGKEGSFAFRVSPERRPEESRLEIRYSPTLALAMVDALPYLAEYPYGCTEQTLSRFLPTVITQRVLQRMGVRLGEIQEKLTNLNTQEIGDDVKRQKDWKRLAQEKRWNGEAWVDRNPVFDEKKVADMSKAGIDRLTAMQCADGGWGWFSGDREYSSPHTTAHVVHGLQMARANGLKIPSGVLDRGVAWLNRYRDGEVKKIVLGPKARDGKSAADDLDAYVQGVLVDEKRDDAKMAEFLYRDRKGLSVYAKALAGLAFHATGRTAERDMIVQNIRQFLVEDKENQTAYLRLGNENYWWHWYGSEMEAHAAFLRLLSAVDPKGETAPQLVKYLLNNRRHASYWNSTRDTALVVEAFADYLQATGEDQPDMTVEVVVDGKTIKTVRIQPENLFTFDNKLVMEGAALTDGAHNVVLKKKGRGPLYWNAYLTNFTLEDPITKAGLEIIINRAYYKLVEVDKTIKDSGSRGQVLDRRIEKTRRVPLANLAEVKSGDIVLVELTVESKNDYEYIVFEDMKPAGFEPVEIQSGYGDNGLGAYMELRDERVAFFLRTLGRGRHSLSYQLRAEIPGSFSALPARASAMYAPELKANSDELKLRIAD
ncbi:MAG: alpha-2-macroglobulin [Elusimicrobia bacterium]|nr:alpha-2-macroglobulin [Elusimicrobiota bacterium]